MDGLNDHTAWRARGIGATSSGRPLHDVSIESEPEMTRLGLNQVGYVLEFMPGPALLLDAHHRVVHANPAATTLLQEGDGLHLDRAGCLRPVAALPAEGRALNRCFAAALSTKPTDDTHVHGPVRLSRPSGRAALLVLAASMLPAPVRGDRAGGGQLALVLIVDPEPQLRNVEAVLQSAAGLTPTEARVAALVGGGFGGPQTAARLKVSTPTMKSHLGSCFEKLGVHSQVGLARLLSGLPAVASPIAIKRTQGCARRATLPASDGADEQHRRAAAVCSLVAPAQCYCADSPHDPDRHASPGVHPSSMR